MAFPLRVAAAAAVLAGVASAFGPPSNEATVLVFGDSQGDVGPTYQVVADVLQEHGVAHKVVNVAVGGTLSCGWAQDPASLAKASTKHFGRDGAKFVWFTAGGNDMAQDAKYHSCLDGARTDADALACLQAATDRLLPCTVALLEGLWSAHPNASVGMYNYEVPCMEGSCLAGAEQFLGGSYCARSPDPIACLVHQLVHWQAIYVDELQRRYPVPQFVGMNVLGAVQNASGVPGASIGHPSTAAGSRCDWMIACVHPKYGTPTATAIGDAMWDLWASKV